MPLTIEVEQEDDGRWLAEVPDVAGVMADGVSPLLVHAAITALRASLPVLPPSSSAFPHPTIAAIATAASLQL